MPRIITAPFHPDLECRLADEVRSAKRDDPLRPLAILVPSHQLARRVKWLLAVEEGLTLLDVHVLTFHQLAVKVISDVRPEAMPHAVNPAFREQLLRSLVYRAIPGVDDSKVLTAGARDRLAVKIRDRAVAYSDGT